MLRALVLAGLLTACGHPDEELCTRLSSWDASAHQGTCLVPQLKNAYSQPACMQSLETCSDKDLSTVSGYADCLDSLPVCTAGNEAAFSTAWWDCQNKLLAARYPCGS
jgi:hypothetical protein